MNGSGVIITISAKTGRSEAKALATDLVAMYRAFAESQGWSTKIIESQATGSGEVDEAVILVAGAEVFESLRFENGLHRRQRVPASEDQGRIHTSTAEVTVISKEENSEAGTQLESGSNKIRTYNVPNRTAIDHRIGQSIFELEAVMRGDLSDLINALRER